MKRKITFYILLSTCLLISSCTVETVIIKYGELQGERISFIELGKQVVISDAHIVKIGGLLTGEPVRARCYVSIFISNLSNKSINLEPNNVQFQADLFDKFDKIKFSKPNGDSLLNLEILPAESNEFFLGFDAFPKQNLGSPDSSEIRVKIPILEKTIQLKFSAKRTL